MPSYSFDFRGAGKHTEKLNHITIYPPSTEAPDRYVIKHYFEERRHPEVFEFRKEAGPELIRHLQEAIGMGDMGKAEKEVPRRKTRAL
jgi:hypothetical protein